MKNLRLQDLIFLPIIIGIIFNFALTGFAFITAGPEEILNYLNFLTKKPLTEIPGYASALLFWSGVFAVLSAVLLLVGIIGERRSPAKGASGLTWGLLAAITAIVLYGGMVRAVSNHALSATLFFYASILYLLLWFIEKRGDRISGILSVVKLLPMYAMVFYTMGMPGFQKIFNPDLVLGNYNAMFKDTILVTITGNVNAFIYFLGALELVVPVLLLTSLAKAEFLAGRKKVFLEWSLFITTVTFVLLSFGLVMIGNFPGAANLIIYGAFTTLFYVMIKSDDNGVQPLKKSSSAL